MLPRRFLARSKARLSASIYVRNLRTFLNWLQAEGPILADLASAIHAPETYTHADNLLTDDEVSRLLAVCYQEPWSIRDRAVLLTFLDTGLRFKEMELLRRDQLHFDAQFGTMSTAGRVCQKPDSPAYVTQANGNPMGV